MPAPKVVPRLLVHLLSLGPSFDHPVAPNREAGPAPAGPFPGEAGQGRLGDGPGRPPRDVALLRGAEGPRRPCANRGRRPARPASPGPAASGARRSRGPTPAGQPQLRPPVRSAPSLLPVSTPPNIFYRSYPTSGRRQPVFVCR